MNWTFRKGIPQGGGGKDPPTPERFILKGSPEVPPHQNNVTASVLAALKETTRMRKAIFFLLIFFVVGVPMAVRAGSVYLPLIIRTQTLQNGDFEKGPDGSWKETSSNGYPLILTGGDLQGLLPQGGSWAVWMGGNNNETSRLSQTIYVPDQATTLNYYYWIESYELAENCGFDNALLSFGGTTQKTYVLCESNNTNQWVLGQIRSKGRISCCPGARPGLRDFRRFPYGFARSISFSQPRGAKLDDYPQ